ncbi:MAG: trigger factor [Planctomycetota bacterium]
MGEDKDKVAANDQAEDVQQSDQQQEEDNVNTEISWDSQCECTVRAEVDAEYLEERYQDELQTLKQEAQIPGFRPGKAPLGLVKRRFGQRMAEDLIATVLREAFDEAAEEYDLSVVNTVDAPDPEEIDWEAGDPLEFEFALEVLPEIDVEPAQYTDVEVEVPRQEVTEERVEEELENFAQQMASWEEVEDGTIDMEDYISAHVHVADDPDAEWSQELEFVPEDRQIGPFNVDGIKGALTGAHPGDKIVVEGDLPEDEFPEGDSPLGELDEEPVTLQIDIQSVYRREVPEIDQELAEQIGMESVDELRDHLRERIEQEIENQNERMTREILLEALQERFDLQMPPSLVGDATQDMLRQMMIRAMREGNSRQEAEQMARSNAQMSRARAERNLKINYILRQIAENERIYALDGEVQEQIKALASRQDWSVERTERYLEENDMMSDLRWDLREEKVIDFLKDNATIKPVSPEEYQEKLQSEQETLQEEIDERDQEMDRTEQETAETEDEESDDTADEEGTSAETEEESEQK